MEESNKRFDKIEEKLDTQLEKLSTELVEIKIQLTRNTDSLIVHEKRSDALEEQTELLRKDVAPIKVHVQAVKTVIYFLGIASSLLLFLDKMGILQKLFS